jgi:hypothetical protein
MRRDRTGAARPASDELPSCGRISRAGRKSRFRPAPDRRRPGTGQGSRSGCWRLPTASIPPGGGSSAVLLRAGLRARGTTAAALDADLARGPAASRSARSCPRALGRPVARGQETCWRRSRRGRGLGARSFCQQAFDSGRPRWHLASQVQQRKGGDPMSHSEVARRAGPTNEAPVTSARIA